MWELTIEPNLESTPTPLLLVRALGGSANATASMLRARPPIFGSHRLYSRFAEKPYLKLVSELRKLTEVSITKAREALAASNNSVSAALVWLQNGLTVSSAQKVVKVAHCTAGDGLFGASVLARGTGSETGHDRVRAAIVELNCETDFVARNALLRTSSRMSPIPPRASTGGGHKSLMATTSPAGGFVKGKTVCAVW